MYDNVQTHKGVWNVKIVQTLVVWSFKDAPPENKTIYSIVIYLNQEQLKMCAITHFKSTSKMVYSLSSKKMSSNYNFSEIQRQENLNLLIMKRVNSCIISTRHNYVFDQYAYPRFGDSFRRMTSEFNLASKFYWLRVWRYFKFFL